MCPQTRRGLVAFTCQAAQDNPDQTQLTVASRKANDEE